MRRLRKLRPSPPMAVAVTALAVALGGTAAATTRLVGGDSVIRKGSLSGNRLRAHTIGRSEVNILALGEVAKAAHADAAATATLATDATTAGRIGEITYLSAPFTAPANARMTGRVNCGSGTFAVGGGTTSPDESTGFSDFLVDSHPTSDRTGWQVTVENDTAVDLTETVWTVCLPAARTG
jgi:hypothetical protein